MNPNPTHPTPSRSSQSILPRLLILAAALLGVALAPPLSGAEPVPYSGVVKGAIVTDYDLVHQASVSTVVSNPLGRCSQLFETMDFQLWEQDGLHYLGAFGLGVTTTLAGEKLLIEFDLVGVLARHNTLVYSGTYRVVGGGSGRFGYGNRTAGLGKGTVEGTATIVPHPGTGTLMFRFKHTFRGDLLLESVRVR